MPPLTRNVSLRCSPEKEFPARLDEDRPNESQGALDGCNTPERHALENQSAAKRPASNPRSVHEFVWVGLRVDCDNWFPLLLFGYPQLREIKASLKLH